MERKSEEKCRYDTKQSYMLFDVLDYVRQEGKHVMQVLIFLMHNHLNMLI